jgi:hypothetical protein
VRRTFLRWLLGGLLRMGAGWLMSELGELEMEGSRGSSLKMQDARSKIKFQTNRGGNRWKSWSATTDLATAAATTPAPDSPFPRATGTGSFAAHDDGLIQAILRDDRDSPLLVERRW